MKAKLFTSAMAGFAALGAGLSAPAVAQSGNDFMGDIVMVGYTFCPRTMLDASGQLLPIAQNSALFSLYGTTYGGDGRTTFALPDLRGRTPLHYGTGPGLSNIPIGQPFGVERNTMTVTTMPTHGHAAFGTTSQPNQTSPGGHTIGSFSSGPNRFAADTPDTPMETGTITNTGNGASFNNIAPVQAIRYCVVTQGVYPSRN